MRIFSRACVSDEHVLPGDPRRGSNLPTFHSEAEMRRQQQKARNEYEYVQREYGYDNMPPSQYVPSISLDSSQEAKEPMIDMVEEPESDISGSESDSEYVAEGYKDQAMHTSRGKARTVESSRTAHTRTKRYADLRGLGDEYLVIDRVPTAFGYHSDDSAENLIEEKSRVSRYSIDPRGANAASDTSDDDDVLGNRYFSTSESIEEQWPLKKSERSKQKATSYVKEMLADDWNTHGIKNSSLHHQSKSIKHPNSNRATASMRGYLSASGRQQDAENGGSKTGEKKQPNTGSSQSRSKKDRRKRSSKQHVWKQMSDGKNDMAPPENIHFLSNAPRRREFNRFRNGTSNMRDHETISRKDSMKRPPRGLFGRWDGSRSQMSISSRERVIKNVDRNLEERELQSIGRDIRNNHVEHAGQRRNKSLGRSEVLRGSLSIQNEEDTRESKELLRGSLSMLHGEPPSMTDVSYEHFKYYHEGPLQHQSRRSGTSSRLDFESQSVSYPYEDDEGILLPPHHRATTLPIRSGQSIHTTHIRSRSPSPAMPFESFQDPAPVLRNNSYRARRVQRNYPRRSNHLKASGIISGTPKSYNDDHQSPRFVDLRRHGKSPRNNNSRRLHGYTPPPRASQAAGDIVAGVAGCYPGYNF